MRAKTKLSKPKRILRRTIISIVVFLLAFIVFFEFTVEDRLKLLIIADIKSLGRITVNETVSTFIEDNPNLCKALVDVNTDNSGVKYLSESSEKVNALKSEISVNTTKALINALNKNSVDVKLGNFTGLVFLSDVGPYIHFDIDAMPTISCEIKSTFESAGINQTIHHIRLIVSADIYIGNPFRIKSVKFVTDYEISQTVIVANTPSAYGNIVR